MFYFFPFHCLWDKLLSASYCQLLNSFYWHKTRKVLWKVSVYQLTSSLDSSEKAQRTMHLKDCALPRDWRYGFSLFFCFSFIRPFHMNVYTSCISPYFSKARNKTRNSTSINCPWEWLFPKKYWEGICLYSRHTNELQTVWLLWFILKIAVGSGPWLISP